MRSRSQNFGHDQSPIQQMFKIIQDQQQVLVANKFQECFLQIAPIGYLATHGVYQSRQDRVYIR